MTTEDPLARKIRWRLVKDSSDGTFPDVPVVFSSELSPVKLADLGDEQADAPQEFGALPNFRLRVLPVLGTTPAIFGNAMAAYVMCQLGGFDLTCVPTRECLQQGLR